jgi:phospholipid/cholesterol/gamma-HCH transport system substrate-binding protein
MKRRDEVLVGLLLIIATVVGFSGTIWLARGGLASGYPVYARFQWGAGLKSGQPVLLAGVNVGFVQRVELIPDGTLVVTMAIKEEYQIPIGSTAAVEPNGIFGDQLIALTPVRMVTTYHAAGDTLAVGEGSPTTADLLASGDSIATDVERIAATVRREFVDGGGIVELRRASTDLAVLIRELGTIARTQSEELSRTQQLLRRTLAAVDSLAVDSTVRNAQRTAASLAQLSEELSVTQQQVRSIVTKLDSGEGTAGLLLNDPTIYRRVDSLLLRLDALAADVKANPRRYIKLSIF